MRRWRPRSSATRPCASVRTKASVPPPGARAYVVAAHQPASRVPSGGGIWKRTAWGAQHDAVTLRPSAARTFEPVALASAESVGVVRFLIEFVRVPDAHLGYLALDWVTMGQLLSLPMIAAGGVLLLMAYRDRRPSGNFV